MTIPVQLGGGIRDMATIEMWLQKGVRRVILGTVAVRDPDFVREACRRFPGRIVVGIDARDGMVAAEGWPRTSRIRALDLAKTGRPAGWERVCQSVMFRVVTVQVKKKYCNTQQETQTQT